MAVVVSIPDDIAIKITELTKERDPKKAIRDVLKRIVYGHQTDINVIVDIIRKELRDIIREELRNIFKEYQTRKSSSSVSAPSSTSSKMVLYRKNIDINGNIYTFVVKRAKSGKVCVFLYKDDKKISVLGEFTDDGFKIYDNHIKKVCESINIKEDGILGMLYSFVDEYVKMVYDKVVEEAYSRGGKISTEDIKKVLEKYGLSYERFKIEHPVEIIQEDENTWSVMEKV